MLPVPVPVSFIFPNCSRASFPQRPPQLLLLYEGAGTSIQGDFCHDLQTGVRACGRCGRGLAGVLESAWRPSLSLFSSFSQKKRVPIPEMENTPVFLESTPPPVFTRFSGRLGRGSGGGGFIWSENNEMCCLRIVDR